MDEPSEGLAPAIIEHLIETFKKLEEEGLAILLIEQNLGMATAIADRQLVMVAGAIAAETTAAALSTDMELQRRYLGVEPLAERRSERDGDGRPASGRSTPKGVEYAYLRDRLLEHGVDVLVVDAGVHEPVGLEPDVARGEVARAGGADVAELAARGDRGAAVAAMAAGAEEVVRGLYADGPARRDPRAGRLGRLVDRDPGDARAAGRRPQADGLDASRRATPGRTSEPST